MRPVPASRASLGNSRDINTERSRSSACYATARESASTDYRRGVGRLRGEVDAPSRHTHVSERESLLGHTPAETLARPPFDLMPPGRGAAGGRVRRRHYRRAEETPFASFDSINRAQGRQLCATCGPTMLILAADSISVGYRGFGSGQHRPKDRRAGSVVNARDMLGAVINTIPDLIWLRRDVEGRYLVCNAFLEWPSASEPTSWARRISTLSRPRWPNASGAKAGPRGPGGGAIFRSMTRRRSASCRTAAGVPITTKAPYQ